MKEFSLGAWLTSLFLLCFILEMNIGLLIWTVVMFFVWFSKTFTKADR